MFLAIANCIYRDVMPMTSVDCNSHRCAVAIRAKMLGIDTILGTVCIVEKSIYSGGLANVGRWPAFFVPGNRGVALRQRRRKRRQ